MSEEQIDKPRLNWRPFGRSEGERRPDFFASMAGVGYGRVHRLFAGRDAGRWHWTASTWDMKEVSGVADGSRAAAVAAERMLDKIAARETGTAKGGRETALSEPAAPGLPSQGPAQNVALAVGVSPTSEA